MLDYKIEVHIDHTNLVHDTFLMLSDRVMLWILVIKEYGPELFYILGPNNVVPDALSKLHKVNDVEEEQMFPRKVKNWYVQANNLNEECPLNETIISQSQMEEISVQTSDLKKIEK